MARFLRLAVLISILHLPTFAADDTGYCVLYDFPDQGDDWYAGESAPDPRYDFHGTLSQSFGDGNDFDLGYYPSLDPHGLGPPLTATQTSLYEYVFRHGELEVPDNPPWGNGGGGGGCSPNCCLDDAECQDPSFCNGQETCDASGFCRAGSPINCGDADSCTADTCNEVIDVCVHAPINAPGEIRSLEAWKIAPASTDMGLGWFPQLPSDTYNAYRAAGADLADLACLQSALTGTSTVDADPLPPGGLYFYLVTGYGCGGESTLGLDSHGQVRANAAPCLVAP